MTDGYEAASGKQSSQQLGATMSVIDAGVAALQAAANPLDKAEVAKAISTLKTTTSVGEVDFNTGPVPHVVAVTRFVNTQYQKTKPGSKWKFQSVVVENSEDPNVPIGSQVIPFNA
jgi:branched-chain amino acid transport system substrate-binding protein